jgi:hypothetical protein
MDAGPTREGKAAGKELETQGLQQNRYGIITKQRDQAKACMGNSMSNTRCIYSRR